MMQKIVPHLWFDTQAQEAAAFYTSIFPNSAIHGRTVLRNTPSGDAELVRFSLAGYAFSAISAGPYFQFNPSVSFMLNFDPARDPAAREHLDGLWHRLADGGTVLMPLDAYPFSRRYGWVQDRYGLSWQLILTDPQGEVRPFIVPSLLFVGAVCGRAEEAVDFYVSLFPNSAKGTVVHYGSDQPPNREGTLMFADFMLANQWFAAMDSAFEHAFAFNEAVSFMVYCETQEEMDRYWKALSAVPEAEQCGWIKDRFGLSWQIVPVEMETMLSQGTQEQIDRVVQALLPMKAIDVAALRKAYQ